MKNYSYRTYFWHDYFNVLCLFKHSPYVVHPSLQLSFLVLIAEPFAPKKTNLAFRGVLFTSIIQTKSANTALSTGRTLLVNVRA